MAIHSEATARTARLDRPSRILVWGVAGLAALYFLIALVPGPSDNPVTRPVATALLFAGVVTRVLLAARRLPSQRLALAALAGSWLTWATASVVVAVTTVPVAPSVVTLPLSPAEWLNLVANCALVMFLILDARGREQPSLPVVVEAVILTGGAACLAGLVLLVLAPVELRMGTAALTALLYPVVDVLLILLVVAQIGLRQRAPGLRTALLLAGLGFLAVADAAFASSLAAGHYYFAPLLAMTWAMAVVLITVAACMPRSSTTGVPVRRGGGLVLLSAAVVALVVLVLPDPAISAWHVQGAAVLTLVATGARMVIALREATRATAAYRMSLTDELTGLPNRRGVLAAAEHAGPGTTRSLLVLGIDAIDDVNASFGYAGGDDVLRLLALRLREAVHEPVTVGRVGADEFAVLLAQDDPDEVLRRAQELRRVLSQPLRLGALELVLGVSVGAAVGAPGDSSSLLLQRGHAAARRASALRGGVVMSQDADRSVDHLTLGEALRGAIAAGQLVPWYQPQVDARTGRVTGVEALVRWARPGHDVGLPATFLATARHAGLMPALTEAVLAQAIRDAARWAGAGLNWRVSVNISPPELMSGAVTPRLLTDMAAWDLRPGQVVLEVTEDIFLNEPGRACVLLDDLHAHGVDISIDDFGTGFSSLSYLRDLTVQELKIDRSFVASLVADERSRMIVRSTTQMAHALGLRVIAEGVETRETAAALAALGVDCLQGFHIAHPMPRASLEDWAARR